MTHEDREEEVQLPRNAVALMSEGALYCLDHVGVTTRGDMEDGFVIPVEQDHEWLESNACCSICGHIFAPSED